MKSKKILAVLMAAGMTLSLAACGSDKKSEDKKVEVTKAEDLKDLTIGVQQGTTGQYYIEGSEDWGFPGLPAKCVTYKSGSLAVQDMLNGNIQYVIIDAAPAAAITTAINAVQ